MTVSDCQPFSHSWRDLLSLRVRLRRDLRIRFVRSGEAPGFLNDPDQGRSYALSPWQCRFLEQLNRAEAVSEAVRTVIRDCPETATRPSIARFVNWLQEKRFLTSLASPLEIGSVDARAFTAPEVFSGESPVLLRVLMHATTVVVLAIGLWKLSPGSRSSSAAVEAPEQSMAAASDRLEPEMVLLRASCAGILTEVLVRHGDKVEAGELVAKIEDPEVLELLKELRRELGECRLRRDRYYEDREQESYTQELRQMADISRRIGEHQANTSLGELRAPVSGQVFAGVHWDRVGSRVMEGDLLLRVWIPESKSSEPNLLAKAP